MTATNPIERLLNVAAQKKIPSAPSNIHSKVWNEIETRKDGVFGLILPTLDFRFAVASIGLAVAIGLFSSYFFLDKSPLHSPTHQFKQAYSLDFFSTRGDRLTSYYSEKESK